MESGRRVAGSGHRACSPGYSGATQAAGLAVSQGWNHQRLPREQQGVPGVLFCLVLWISWKNTDDTQLLTSGKFTQTQRNEVEKGTLVVSSGKVSSTPAALCCEHVL